MLSVNEEQQKLACIHIRAETSKVRTSLTCLCRNGQYFERLSEISKPKSADELIFYHLNDEIRLTKAVADYRRNAEGTLLKSFKLAQQRCVSSHR